jgi:hypothetical protein
MDHKKICVIIHVENAAIASCALESVQALILPEGYLMEILPVEDTDSTVEAYQFGMDSSDAKYKLYIKENTVLLDTQMLDRAIRVFEADAEIGVIGWAGIKKIIPSTQIYHGLLENRGIVGQRLILADSGDSTLTYPYREGEMTAVEAVDSSVFITSVDIQWNRERYSRAHHACMQYSVDLREKGYKSVVMSTENVCFAVGSYTNPLDISCFESEKQAFLRANKESFPPVGIMLPTYHRVQWFEVPLHSLPDQTFSYIPIFF